jgi:dihydrodipicolinate synthase/N-acetylneuraminate lyase
MNTGAPSTVQAVHYTRVAKVLGADAVMIAPPVVPGIATSLVHRTFSKSPRAPIFPFSCRT